MRLSATGFECGKENNEKPYSSCLFAHTADSVLIFTTELIGIKRKSLFDPVLLLQIGFWPVLAGVVLYYLYRKATKETSSAKHEFKSNKKSKRK